MRKRLVVQTKALMTMLNQHVKRRKKTDEHPDGWNMNKWKHGDHPLKPPTQFTATSDINFDIPEDTNKLYFFKLFFTDELFEYLTDETNRYAQDFFQVNKYKLRSSSECQKMAFHRVK